MFQTTQLLSIDSGVCVCVCVCHVPSCSLRCVFHVIHCVLSLCYLFLLSFQIPLCCPRVSAPPVIVYPAPTVSLSSPYGSMFCLCLCWPPAVSYVELSSGPLLVLISPYLVCVFPSVCASSSLFLSVKRSSFLPVIPE